MDWVKNGGKCVIGKTTPVKDLTSIPSPNLLVKNNQLLIFVVTKFIESLDKLRLAGYS